jgi:hypothetical protein
MAQSSPMAFSTAELRETRALRLILAISSRSFNGTAEL